MTTEDARNQLMWAIQALACEPAVQLRLFPNFTCKADELADDFLNWHGATKWRDDLEFSPEHLRLLSDMASKFNAMSGDRFTETQIISGDDWREIRELARVALARFGWPQDVPSTERSSYVIAAPDHDKPNI